MTEDVIYSKQMFDPRFSELTTKFKVDTCLPMVKLNQMTSLFSAACFNVARLVILIFMIFATMYNGAVANALVLCVGTNGHIEIELVEGGVASDCFHHQKVSTNKSTVDRFTSLQKTYAFEDLAQHTDLSGKSVALSQRNTDIDVPLFELAEPKFFLVAALSERRIPTYKSYTLSSLDKARTRTVLDELNTVILRR